MLISSLQISDSHLHRIDSEVSRQNLKVGRIWCPTGELPDLKTTTSLHVHRKYRVSRLRLPVSVSGHQVGSGFIFKNRNIHGKCFAIPSPSFVNILNPYSDLLNSVDLVRLDRKSTRLNSSHVKISYAV